MLPALDWIPLYIKFITGNFLQLNSKRFAFGRDHYLYKLFICLGRDWFMKQRAALLP